MQIFDTMHRAPRFVARRLAALGLGLMLATSLLTPGTTLAAPRASCTDVACIINAGNALIAARMTALSTVNTRVAAVLAKGHITSTQAAALQADVTTNQTGLTALKTKLDAETTMQAATQDVKSIFTQFRIYAVVLPRDYHELWLDILMYVDGKLKAVRDKIQSLIQQVDSLYHDGDHDSDKAALHAAFADYNAQLAEAEAQIDAAQGQEATLTVQHFDNDRTVYTTAFTDFRSDIRSAHTDIAKAAGDLHKIAGLLRSLLGDRKATTAATATP